MEAEVGRLGRLVLWGGWRRGGGEVVKSVDRSGKLAGKRDGEGKRWGREEEEEE